MEQCVQLACYCSLMGKDEAVIDVTFSGDPSPSAIRRVGGQEVAAVIVEAAQHGSP